MATATKRSHEEFRAEETEASEEPRSKKTKTISDSSRKHGGYKTIPTATKRSYDEFSAKEAEASSVSQTSHIDEPRYKKTKKTKKGQHRVSSNESQNDAPEKEASRPMSRKAPTPVIPDEEETPEAFDGDAEEEDSESSAQGVVPLQVPVAPNPTIIAPRIRASSADQNIYMPSASDPDTRAAYIAEVGDRYLLPICLPPVSTGSRVSSTHRQIIEDRLFHGLQLDECLRRHQQRGGTGNTNAGISKAFYKWVAIWFTEENVVMPWNAFHRDDRKRLMQLGLSAENFPVLHPPVSSAPVPDPAPLAAAPGPVAQAKAPKQPSRPAAKNVITRKDRSDTSLDMEVQSPLEPSVPSHNARQELEAEEGSDEETSASTSHLDSNTEPMARVSMSNLHATVEEELEEEEDIYAKYASRSVRVSDETDEDAEEGTEDRGNYKEVPIYHRIRAAANKACESSVIFEVDGKSYKGDKEAFSTYCGTIRSMIEENQLEGDLEIELGDTSQKVVRAMVQALSPYPSYSLPTVLFIFDEGVVSEHTHTTKDRFGFLDEANAPAEEIQWDVPSCLEMYDLARELDCNVLKDMVTDEMFRIVYAKRQEMREHFIPGALDLGISQNYLNTLDAEADAAFIRTIGDYNLIMARPDFNSRDEIPKYVASALERWPREMRAFNPMRCGRQHSHSLQAQHFHHHARMDECYHHIAQEGRRKMSKILHETFGKFRSYVDQTYDAEIAKLDGSDKDVKKSLQVERGVVQSSMMHEEKATQALYKIEQANYCLDHSEKEHWEEIREELEKWQDIAAKVRNEYEGLWSRFDENR